MRCRTAILSFLMVAVHSNLFNLLLAQPFELRQPGFRTWQDASGAHATDASIKKIGIKSVFLRKSNGVDIEVPFEHLSDEDLEYLESIQQRSVQNLKLARSRMSGQAAATNADTKIEFGDHAARSDVFDIQLVEYLPVRLRPVFANVLLSRSRAHQIARIKDLHQALLGETNVIAIRIVKNIARHSDPEYRQLAILMLADIDPEGSSALIANAMNDTDSNVRMAAYSARNRIKNFKD